MPHSEERKAYQREDFKQRYRERRNAGVCVQCCAPTDKPRCPEHTRKAYDVVEEIRNTRKSNGCCPLCDDFSSTESVYCERHLNQTRQYNRSYYLSHRAEILIGS